MKYLSIITVIFLTACGGESSGECDQSACIHEGQVLQFHGSHHHGYDHLEMPAVELKDGVNVAYWEFEAGLYSHDGNLQFWTTGDPKKTSLKIVNNYEYTEEYRVRVLLDSGEYSPYQTVLVNAGRLL